MILVVIGLVFIFAAAAQVIFKFLKSRNMIRVIKIYEMDKRPAKFEEVLKERELNQQKLKQERTKGKDPDVEDPELLKDKHKQGSTDAGIVWATMTMLSGFHYFIVS